MFYFSSNLAKIIEIFLKSNVFVKNNHVFCASKT